MKMDVHDWQRLYHESMEKYNSVFEDLKTTLEGVESICEQSDDEQIRELAEILSDARRSAEMEVDQIRQLGKVMTML